MQNDQLHVVDRYRVLVFDFDGVILDSNKVKELAFQELFRDRGPRVCDAIADYHRKNLGVPRSNKIRYVFEELLGETCVDSKLDSYCGKFSEITLAALSDKKYQIADTIDFISKAASQRKKLYIASAAAESDVVHLCEKHEISSYFAGIYGSPRTKLNILRSISDGYDLGDVVMVGDSTHDYDAAKSAGVDFIGYNNPKLKRYGSYIESFCSLSS